MKITFVQSEIENLAVEYLSNILKSHGHSVYLAFDPKPFNTVAIKSSFGKRLFDIKDIFVKEIILSNPDLIAFSVLTGDYLWALDIAKSLKEKIDVPIIFGGIHPTSVPEVVINNKHVDIVCIGEGEYPLLELVDSLGSGINYSIKNLWFKRNGEIIRNEIRPLLEDLDSLPFPDKEIFYRKAPVFKNCYELMISRGCPYACSYCYNNIVKKIYKGKGRYLRIRSVGNVMEELNMAIEKYRPKYFSFRDDIFTMNKAWLKEFIIRYKKEINRGFFCFTHSKFIDEEIAKLLKYGGCYWLNIGVQTVSENNRCKILNRIGTNEEISHAAMNCNKAGLRFSVDHIFNIPYEGEKEYIDALKFYNKLRPSSINSYYMKYYPKTEIIDTAKEAGIIDDDIVKDIEMGKYSMPFILGAGEASKLKFYNKDKEKTYNNFIFLFSLLPLIPQRLMIKMIEKKWYNLSFPMFFTLLIKLIVKLRDDREYLYIAITRLTYFAFQNLKLKFKSQ